MSRGGTRIYLGRLPRDVRERDLEKFVRGYGRVREVSIKVGYGFVEFDDSRDAEDAVYDLNGKDFLGERIVVEHARNPERRVDFGYRSFSSSSRYNESKRSRRGRTPPVRTEHRLAVENLSSRVNWQDLKEYMMKAGDVTFADAHKRKKGEGVVEFRSKDDMKNALKKLDDTEFFGRRIVLKVEKVRRRTRSRSRSRSRSRRRRTRSHSHSRSRSRSPKRRRARKSRSKSKSKSHSKSPSPAKEITERKSKSRSPSVEPDKSQSVSPSPQREETSPERHESPVENGDEENGEAEAEAEAEADEVVDEMEDNEEDDE